MTDQRDKEKAQFEYHRDAAHKPPWQGTDAYGAMAEAFRKAEEEKAERERRAARRDKRQASLF